MPPVKERRTRRSFSLHPCSIFHIPLRKRSVRRSGAAPDPRRCRGAGDRSVKTIRLKSRGLHRSIWDKSWGSLASTHPHGPCAVRVRGPRETNYRAHTRRLLSRAAPAVSIAQFFGRTPAFFPTFFSGKIFRCVCAESCAQLQRLHRHPPGGGGTLFRQRSPSAVSFLVARSCIASCAALDRLTRFQRQYAYSG